MNFRTVTLRHGPCDGMLSQVAPGQVVIIKPTAPDWHYTPPMAHVYRGIEGAAEYFYDGIVERSALRGGDHRRAA